ncbi:glycosyltransferase family 4 protein [Dongia sp.]|uniref:glycosyltransferase family 4 protein n=1 Tax=Dongia sp. TaxID=1977262 RepID=UPI0035B0B592
MAKSVLHLVYSLGGRGSVPRRAQLDAEVALAAGHNVAFVTDRVAGPVPTGVKIVTPRRSWHRRLPGLLRELGAMLVIHFLLRRYLATGKADVIVFHDSTLCWPAFWNARGRPTVYMVHALIRDRIESGANPYGAVRAWLYRQANRAGLARATHIVCVSKYMAQLAVAEGADRDAVSVVPNLLNLAEFDASYAPRYDVIYAGRLSVEKGVASLLSALEDLDPEIKVAIVGDGPQRGMLEKRAAGAGLASCSFLGWVDRPRLRALLASSAIQVVPSLSEPQGVAALEGLAAGTPVIAANVGGLPEMIEPGTNGWLFPPGDAAALKQLLEKALGDRTHLTEMRGAAKRSAAAFDLTTMHSRLERIYL